jgi:hypothetical protein
MRIRLEWHAAPGEGEYQVVVAPEGAGTAALDLPSRQNWILLPPLDPGRYEWHVRRGSLVGPSARFEVPDDVIAY